MVNGPRPARRFVQRAGRVTTERQFFREFRPRFRQQRQATRERVERARLLQRAEQRGPRFFRSVVLAEFGKIRGKPIKELTQADIQVLEAISATDPFSTREKEVAREKLEQVRRPRLVTREGEVKVTPTPKAPAIPPNRIAVREVSRVVPRRARLERFERAVIAQQRREKRIEKFSVFEAIKRGPLAGPGVAPSVARGAIVGVATTATKGFILVPELTARGLAAGEKTILAARGLSMKETRRSTAQELFSAGRKTPRVLGQTLKQPETIGFFAGGIGAGVAIGKIRPVIQKRQPGFIPPEKTGIKLRFGAEQISKKQLLKEQRTVQTLISATQSKKFLKELRSGKLVEVKVIPKAIGKQRRQIGQAGLFLRGQELIGKKPVGRPQTSLEFAGVKGPKLPGTRPKIQITFGEPGGGLILTRGKIQKVPKAQIPTPRTKPQRIKFAREVIKQQRLRPEQPAIAAENIAKLAGERQFTFQPVTPKLPGTGFKFIGKRPDAFTLVRQQPSFGPKFFRQLFGVDKRLELVPVKPLKVPKDPTTPALKPIKPIPTTTVTISSQPVIPLKVPRLIPSTPTRPATIPKVTLPPTTPPSRPRITTPILPPSRPPTTPTRILVPSLPPTTPPTTPPTLPPTTPPTTPPSLPPIFPPSPPPPKPPFIPGLNLEQVVGKKRKRKRGRFPVAIGPSLAGVFLGVRRTPVGRPGRPLFVTGFEARGVDVLGRFKGGGTSTALKSIIGR